MMNISVVFAVLRIDSVPPSEPVALATLVQAMAFRRFTSPAHMVLCVAIALLAVRPAVTIELKKFPLLMPQVNPSRDELYLCTPVKIFPDKSFYIVGFEPNATMNTVHHMLLFGCTTPGTDKPYWDCGEMASESKHQVNPCATGSHVLYAWARDADALKLPEDVGFLIGEGSQIEYLVLQVHYAHKFPPFYRDSSGINLIFTEEPQSKLASVLLLATGGIIPPHGITHMESLCAIDEEKVIHPFAYRTHTHELGKVVSGYVVRKDEAGNHKWTLLGKRDPLTPQMFYKTFTTEPIRHGDILASRCTMESHRDRETFVGPTNDDEMCNFYLLVYVEGGKPLEKKYCLTRGPPTQFWSNSEYNFNNIPDVEASSL